MTRCLSQVLSKHSVMCGAVFSTALFCGVAEAAPKWAPSQNEVQFTLGTNIHDGNIDKSRLTFTSSNRLKLNRKSIIDVDARLEYAEDNTGLGTIDTFSDLSKPIFENENAHLEFDTLTYTQRIGRARLVLGKQVVAWGVLDGIRITDALNPIRLREGVASETRPDRISLWGARLKGKLEDISYDAFFSPDPTVNQVAINGDLFARSATRFRGGFPAQASSVPITRSDRNEYISDAVYGIRLGKGFGESELHFVAISGPDPSPLFRLNLKPNTPPHIELAYERRDLYGIDFVRPAGSFVFRAEASYSPSRHFNTNNNGLLDDFTSAEWTGGVGLDWQAPQDLFVNFQLLGNKIVSPNNFIIRPDEEYLSSLTIRRNFQNDTLKLKGEFIYSLTDGDNFTRLSAEKEIDQTINIGISADIFSGDPQGVFGQFEEKSRVTINLKKSI